MVSSNTVGHSCRIGHHGLTLLGVVEQGERRDAEGVARLVESPADGHLDIRPDLLDRHGLAGHRQQPRDERIVTVGEMVFEHLVECSVDLVERPLPLGPDLGIVGVVAGGVDHRLRPALQIALVGVVEAEHAAQGLRSRRGRRSPR
jgi:hypothetical protein